MTHRWDPPGVAWKPAGSSCRSRRCCVLGKRAPTRRPVMRAGLPPLCNFSVPLAVPRAPLPLACPCGLRLSHFRVVDHSLRSPWLEWTLGFAACSRVATRRGRGETRHTPYLPYETRPGPPRPQGWGVHASLWCAAAVWCGCEACVACEAWGTACCVCCVGCATHGARSRAGRLFHITWVSCECVLAGWRTHAHTPTAPLPQPFVSTTQVAYRTFVRPRACV